MMLPKCPHCKTVDTVYANVRACGWCEQHYSLEGQVIETVTDSMYFTRSKTLRCCSCGRVRRDIILIGDTVYEKGKPKHGTESIK